MENTFATLRRVVAREIPVAGRIWAASAHVVDRLEDDVHLGLHPLRRDQPGDLGRKLGERVTRVKGADVVRLRDRTIALEIDERLEGHQFAQRRHVDAVAVRIADRRCRRGDDDPLRTQSVQHRQDRVLHRVAANDRVVQNDERIRPRPHEPVRDVVDVLVELPPRRRIGDERAELGVLDSDLAEPDRPAFGEALRPERLQESVERDERRVGNVAEERVLEIASDGVKKRFRQSGAERLALTVDVRVVCAGEVDALEDAAAPFARLENLLKRNRPIRGNDHRFARTKFLHCLRHQIEGGLDRRALGRHDGDVVVDIAIARTNAVRVADRETPAVTRHSTERIRPVKPRKQHPQSGNEDLTPPLPTSTSFLRLFFPQHARRQPFADEISVGGRFRKLAHSDVGIEKLVRVRQVEVAGQEQRPREACGLVDERMAETDVALAIRRIAKMPEKERLVHPAALGEQRQQIREGAVRRGFEFAIGGLSGLGRQCQRNCPRAVLPPVVLLLEKQRQFRTAIINDSEFRGIMRRIPA